MTASITESISWNEGAHHSIGWVLLICLLVLGVLMNILQMLVHLFIHQMWKLPNAPTILALALQDGIFDFLCLITCVSSFIHERYSPSQCLWQGIYAEFLMSWSGLSICLLYYSCYVSIVKGRSLKPKEVLKIQLCIALYCGILTFLGVIYPGNPRLNSAGLFCYTATQYLPEGIIFYVGYVFPLFSGLFIMNWRLENGLSKMRDTMQEFGLVDNPRPSQVNMLRDMRVYVIAMILCYSPILSVSMYSWVTGDHQPPVMWILFGVSGHLNTIINPILYYVLSMTARKILFSKLYSILKWQCFLTYELCETSVPIRDEIAYSAYFETMIQTHIGQEALKREAATNYSPELTKFLFDDHPAWLALCHGAKLPLDRTPILDSVDRTPILDSVKEDDTELEFISLPDLSSRSSLPKIEKPPLSPEPEREILIAGVERLKYRDIEAPKKKAQSEVELSVTKSTFSDSIESKVNDEKLEKMATFIYKTYIQDIAPYSLNLPTEVRQAVEARLFNGTSIVVGKDNSPQTIFLEVETVVKELIFNNLARQAFHNQDVREAFETHLRVLDSSRGPL